MLHLILTAIIWTIIGTVTIAIALTLLSAVSCLLAFSAGPVLVVVVGGCLFLGIAKASSRKLHA